MRAALVEARDHGIEFEHAWNAALPGAVAGLTPLERNSWAVALRETEDAWRRGFERERVWRLGDIADG